MHTQRRFSGYACGFNSYEKEKVKVKEFFLCDQTSVTGFSESVLRCTSAEAEDLKMGEEMEVDSNHEFKIDLSEEAQSGGTILCKLSPEISAVDMEIRWFKETDLVCFYKNKLLIEGVGYECRQSLLKEELERGHVCLQLKKLDVGDYLCQVTSGNRTQEITVRIAVTHEDQTVLPQTTSSEKIDKEWTDKERIKMANSALSAVFCNLEKIDAQKEDQKTEKQAQTEEDNSEGLMKGMETSKPEEQETKPENKITDRKEICSNQKLLDNGEKMEVESNIFCNLEKIDAQKEDHQTEKQAQTEEDNSEGLRVKTRKGKETSKPEEQETKPENKITDQKEICSNQKLLDNDVKVCIFRTGKTKAADKEFTAVLESRILNLREVGTAKESNIILVFCPAVSRTGTDIDEALKRFNGNTDSKLAVLVVLHHTFDPEKTVPDTSRCVNRTDILTLDCLFHEDTGLLECQKNSEAYDKAVNWLTQQGCKAGVKISLRQSPGQNQYQASESSHKSNQLEGESQQVAKWLKTENNSSSTEGVRLFSNLAGKTNDCDKKFIAILRMQIENLKEVGTVGESDIILIFCPIASRTGPDIEAALNKFNYSTESKPVILVVLHHTFDPEKTVPDSSRCVNRTDILTLDCLFYEDTGLLECQKNSEAYDKAVNWLREQGKKKNIKISPYQNKWPSLPKKLTPW
ncbi:uncharacterized protein LOC143748943 [Siphateles boraxobius]|uniref:uncharacterized protein LOC143748943 n=1 Tax=Siphateles boraxobius TaxID=180520 RepID=UPI0040646FC4